MKEEQVQNSQSSSVAHSAIKSKGKGTPPVENIAEKHN